MCERQRPPAMPGFEILFKEAEKMSVRLERKKQLLIDAEMKVASCRRNI